MAEFSKLNGTLLDSFSIGIKTKKSTISVDGTSIKLDKQLDMDSKKIINVANGVDAGDAVNKGQLDLKASISYVDATFIPLTQKGANGGVATLDSNGKILESQVPSIAVTDVYSIADIAARDALTVQEGDIAIVDDAGSGQPDSYIYDGTSWKVLKKPADVVSSVNGQTGIVSLALDDISDVDTSAKADDYVLSWDNDASKWIAVAIPSAPVSSVFGRTGAVVATAGDYSAEQITATSVGDLAGLTVAAQLEELDTEKASVTYVNTELSGKMDLVSSAVAGNVATLDANGQAVDSGTALSDLATDSEVSSAVSTHNSDANAHSTEMAKKADKVVGAVSGNLAELDANGNLVDSGVVADNVVTISGSQVLSGKSIDADNNPITNLEVDNFKTGVVVTTIGATPLDTELPTAQAVKEYVTANSPVDVIRSIKVPITTSGASSTAKVPENAIIEKVVLRVGTAYDNSAEINVVVNSVTVVGNADSDAAVVANYDIPLYVDNGAESVVTVNVTNSPTAGAGSVIVYYSIPQA